MTIEDTVQFVIRGGRMAAPQIPPQQQQLQALCTMLFPLIVKCWDADPQKRLTFPQVMQSLDEIEQQLRLLLQQYST